MNNGDKDCDQIVAELEAERDALRLIIVKYVNDAAATADERHLIEACDAWHKDQQEQGEMRKPTAEEKALLLKARLPAQLRS